MDYFADATLPELLLVSLSIDAIAFWYCDADATLYVAPTGRMGKDIKTLPHSMERLREVYVGGNDADQGRIAPITPARWPAMRAAVIAQGGRLFQPTDSFEDVQVRTVAAFLIEGYEASVFMAIFPYGRGTYDEAGRPGPLGLTEYFSDICGQATFPRDRHIGKVYSAYGTFLLSSLATFRNQNPQDRRALKLLIGTNRCVVCDQPASNKCSRCKWACYCSVDHQKIDFSLHKSADGCRKKPDVKV